MKSLANILRSFVLRLKKVLARTTCPLLWHGAKTSLETFWNFTWLRDQTPSFDLLGTKYIENSRNSRVSMTFNHKMLDRRLKVFSRCSFRSQFYWVVNWRLEFLGFFGWFPRVGAHGLTKPPSHQAHFKRSTGYLDLSEIFCAHHAYIPLHSITFLHKSPVSKWLDRRVMTWTCPEGLP